MCPTFLPDGWVPVDRQEAARLERQLAAELVAAHPLSGVGAECFARRRDCDDAVFRLRGHRCEFAIVHLTWARESSPTFPATVFCVSLADLVELLRVDSW
jgi:hypothetical protein